MGVWFDITSETFFALSVGSLAPPKHANVIPALKQIQGANIPFPKFAKIFNWRQVRIAPMDQFPGNEVSDIYAFDIKAPGLVTISAHWDGGDGVQCLTAI